MTHSPEQPRQELIEKELEILSSLHPTYTQEQLREARDNLIRYFDLVWEIFLKMRKDGRLDAIFREGTNNPISNDNTGYPN